VNKSNNDWENTLTPEQYRICRLKGTEPPFSGKYNNSKLAGTYSCTCCGSELFSSHEKFDSGSGWPSFWQPISDNAVIAETDHSHGMSGLRSRAAIVMLIWVTYLRMDLNRQVNATASTQYRYS